MEIGAGGGVPVSQALQTQQPSQNQQIRQADAQQQVAELETGNQAPQPAPSANERIGGNVDTFA